MSREIGLFVWVVLACFLVVKIVDQTSWGALGFGLVAIAAIGLQSKLWELQDQLDEQRRMLTNERAARMKMKYGRER